MNRNRWVVVLAMGLVLVGTTGRAAAKDIKYKDRVAGTVAPTPFDFNSDGVTGGSGTLDGRSNRGPVNGGFVAEFDLLALAPDPACPIGTLKLPLVVASGARGFIGTDDQVFLMDTPAASLFCLNADTGVLSIHTEGNFTGGVVATRGRRFVLLNVNKRMIQS